MDKNLPGRAEQRRKKIPLHKPKVKQGAMGILLSPFQGAQSSTKDMPGCFILQESLASFMSAHYIIAATPG